jgi:phosphinothricin acetyltransferase
MKDGAAPPVPFALRTAEARDVSAIAALYGHYVRTSLATFDLVPPTEEEMTRRRYDMLAAGLPFLVAIEASGDRLLGFAYAGSFRPRPAYRFTLEDSIYVAPAVTRCGIGRALLARLIEDATAAGFRQMIAMIGDSANAASIGLHEQAGFARAGLLAAAGFKLGRWIDCVVMQRRRGAGAATPPV